MPHRLGFHIAQVSSEGEGGEARELLHPGPGTKGWVSCQWCVFPQTLTLQLHDRSHLARLQLLAHHTFIPEKIELHIGDVPPDQDVSLQHAKFTLLGHVSLSDNLQSNFKARELKSVSLQCTGTFLRLVMHKNHVNKKNLYNQIGVVGVNLLGNEVEANNNSVSPDGEGGQVPGGGTGGSRGGEPPPHHDLAFAMYVDTRVAATIISLEERRMVAVREERYSYADRLKAAVTQLRSAGELLGKYEIEKRHAIENENYDRAKVKKELAEEYRDEVYRALNIEDLLERKGRLEKNDLPGGSTLPELPSPPKPRSNQSSTDPSPSSTIHLPPTRNPNTPPKPPVSPPRSPSPPPLRTPPTPLPDLRHPGINNTLTPRPPPSPRPNTHAAYTSYDERTLPALKHRSVEERVEVEEEAGGRKVNLSEQDKKDAALPLTVFGKDMVEKVYSKNYSEKEAGLKQLQQHLTAYTGEAGVRPDRYVRAAVVLVRRALRDKVYSVGLLASNTLSHILSHFVSKHKVAKKEVGATVDKVLPELMAKTADNATRTQQLAVQAIITLLDFSLDRGVGSVGSEVARPLTSLVHPRSALCRATIIQSHLVAHGITALPRDKESGFTPKHLVEFAYSAFRHQNSDVRKEGEQLLLSLYTHFPSFVRKTLPIQEDPARKTVLYRNLFEQLETHDKKRESAPPPSPPPSVQHPPPPPVAASVRGSQRNSPPLSTTNTATTTTSNTPTHRSSRPSSSSGSEREEGRGRDTGSEEEEKRAGGRKREREEGRERRDGSEVARLRREEGRRGSREDWRGDDRGGRETDRRNNPEINGAREAWRGVSEERRDDQTDRRDTRRDLRREESDERWRGELRRRESEERRDTVKRRDSEERIIESRRRDSDERRRDNRRQDNLERQIDEEETRQEVRRERQIGAFEEVDTRQERQIEAFREEEARQERQLKVYEEVESIVRREAWEGNMGCGGGVPQISITPDESEVRGRALSRLNGALLPSAPPSPGDPEDKMCIFCGLYDSGFSESGLDVHYWRWCPLLTRCQHCRQVVEVASLTSHMLGECTASSDYRRCERCSEAVHRTSYSTHVLAKTCTPSQPEPLSNHCPLCHDNISPWDQGWRTHLLPGPRACPANPRARSQGSKKTAAKEKSPDRKGNGDGSRGGVVSAREGSRESGVGVGVAAKTRLPSSTGTPGTPRKNVTRRR